MTKQQELDKIIQDGVFNITKLLKNSEADAGGPAAAGPALLVGEDGDVELSSSSVSAQRHHSTNNSSSTGNSKKYINGSSMNDSSAAAVSISRKKRHYLRGESTKKATGYPR